MAFEPELALPVLERAARLVAALDTTHRSDGLRLLGLCGEVLGEVELPTEPRCVVLKRELRELTELLARRGARAMPLGALGRAASARLSGAPRDAARLLQECQEKMDLFHV